MFIKFLGCVYNAIDCVANHNVIDIIHNCYGLYSLCITNINNAVYIVYIVNFLLFVVTQMTVKTSLAYS
jgi:hypothetical protein